MVCCRECGANLSEENWYKSQRKLKSKICKKCIRKKSREAYRRMDEKKRKDIRRAWRKKNPNYYKDYYRKYADGIKKTATEFLIKRKLKLIKMLGGKCVKCGYNKNYSAMAFHHVNPEEKEKNNEWMRRGFEEKIKNGKIMLLCTNCHQELHHPSCNLPERFINELT